MLVLEHATSHDVVPLLTIGNYLPKCLLIILVWIVHWEVRDDWHSCQSPQRLEREPTRKSDIVLMHFGVALFQNGGPPCSIITHLE